MKKFIFSFLAMATIILASCGRDTRIHTSYYTVNPDQWIADITTYPDGTYTTNYYYSKWENVEITPNVIQNGVVLAYLCNGYDEILPYTTYNMDDQGNLYQERIEFDVNPNEPGVIYFIIKDNDFNTAVSMQNIGVMNFKVVTIDQ